MLASDQYQLLDFGAGRKLERIGHYTVDRPAPAAADTAAHGHPMWNTCDARYLRGQAQRDHGTWTFRRRIEGPWTVQCGPTTLELKFTEFGHLGLFPEQAENWQWLARQIAAAGRPLKILNLFAYTGASTLVAAAAGAQVVHVDAAANVVAWARRNAEASDLAAAPIRWITEDATRFVSRELKRGNAYDAVILDPPAYGHGPHGEAWRIDQHLAELLAMCLDLTAASRQFVLLSCHSGQLAFQGPLLKAFVEAARPLRAAGTLTARDLTLDSVAGDPLHCGAAVRWSALAESSQ